MSLFALRSATAIVALLLLWRVVEVNTVLYNWDGRPKLSPAAPAAVDGTGRDDALERALRQNPANVEALLLLARERESARQMQPARSAYRAAYLLAPNDREVMGRSAEFFLRENRVSDALFMLDRLVDGYADARERAFPVMAQLLSQGGERAAWEAILSRHPSWVGPFIESSCASGVDAAILVPLVIERTRADLATAPEIACLVDRLRDSDRWVQAYQLWLNTLPRERLADVGFVFNGGFEYAPSGIGFDWRPTTALERDAGHSVEMPQAAGAGGKRVLRVAYNGKRQAGIPIAQYLALPPGSYEFSGQARPQSIAAGRGVQWTLRCMRKGKASAPLAVSERFIGSSEWRRFAFDVDIPRDCDGQVLQLEPAAASDGPVYLSGSAWFDDLVLRRH